MQIAFRRKQYCVSASSIHPRERGGEEMDGALNFNQEEARSDGGLLSSVYFSVWDTD